MTTDYRHIGKMLLLLAAMALAVASNAFAAPSLEEVVQELNDSGRNLKGAESVEYADRYLELLNDEVIEPADQVYVLQQCMSYLTRTWWGQYLDGTKSKAHQVFALYRGDIIDANPEAEYDLVTSYISVFLGDDAGQNRMRLPEYLAIIDEYEKVLDANRQNPRADFLRGGLCKAAGDWEQAARFMERYISNAADTDDFAYRVIALAYEKSGDFEKMLATISANMERFGSLPNVAPMNAKILVRHLESGKLDESKALDMLPVFAHDGAATRIILSAVADQRLEAGDAGSTLAYVRLSYAVAPIEDMTPTIESVAQYFAKADNDPLRATRFLEYQVYGLSGPDGEVGTDDDCQDVLAGIDSPLPRHVKNAIEDRLKRLTPQADSTYAPLGDRAPRADSAYGLLRDRGNLYLALGRPRDALRVFRSAWDAAPLEWLEEANGLVPRALKALDGTILRANAYMAYQEFGPAGFDGQPGTPDDLIDPLAKEKLPPLPPKVRKALKKISENSAQTIDAYQFGGFACLALGEHKKGFDKLRVAYSMTEPGPDQATIIENIAAAIKTCDGNVQRANQYLLFQKCGPAGPDGQVDTEDDLENPFPSILQDIKKK